MADNQGGRGGRGRGNSSRNAGRGRGNNSRSNDKFKKSTLVGACEDLKDNVYTVGDAKQADRFTKTTEQIANYIQRTYEDGQDVKDSITFMERQNMEKYLPTTIPYRSSSPLRTTRPVDQEQKGESKVTDLEEAKEAEQVTMNPMQRIMLEQQVKEYFTKKARYMNNMNKAYGLIHGQCTQGIKNKLEARKDWKLIEKNHDPIELLTAIKEITQDYQDSKYPIASIHKSLTSLFNMKQEEKESLTAFSKRFNNALDIFKSQFGEIKLEKYVPTMKFYDEDRHEEFEQQATDQLLAYTFLQGVDPKGLVT